MSNSYRATAAEPPEVVEKRAERKQISFPASVYPISNDDWHPQEHGKRAVSVALLSLSRYESEKRVVNPRPDSDRFG